MLNAPPTSPPTIRVLANREAAEAIRTRTAWGELWAAVAREPTTAPEADDDGAGSPEDEAA